MTEKISGIYRIICIENGRYYYGSSVDVWARWGGHRSALRRNGHYNPTVQRSWNKHGESSFRIELIEQVVKDKLIEVEQTYLDENVGKSNCMNIRPRADGPAIGHQLSTLTRRKISKTLAGRKLSKEHREKLCENHPRHWLGKKRSNVSGDNHHRYWLGKKGPWQGKKRPNMQGDKHPRSKLVEKDVLQIRQLREKERLSYQKIANELDIGKSQVFRICNKQSWSHIE